MVTIDLLEDDLDLVHRLIMSFPIFDEKELDDLENLLLEIKEQGENQPKYERNR